MHPLTPARAAWCSVVQPCVPGCLGQAPNNASNMVYFRENTVSHVNSTAVYKSAAATLSLLIALYCLRRSRLLIDDQELNLSFKFRVRVEIVSPDT